MDIEGLVEEIYERVQAHLTQKPKILTLTEQKGMSSYSITEYEAVIAYDLTNENTGKIVNGILDTVYTKTFAEALLLGKRIIVPKEEVELYRYKDTKAAPYYLRLAENLKLLEASGVMIVPREEVLAALEESKTAVSIEETKTLPAITRRVDKKVITERDIKVLRAENVTVIQIDERTLITDLAKEYAAKQKITIRRG